MSQGGSGRNGSANSPSMPSSTRSPSIGLGFLPSSMGNTAGSGFQMGQFSTTASKMSSEERYPAASAGRSISVAGGPLGSHPPGVVRTISQSSTGGTNGSSGTSIMLAGNAGPAAPISSMSPPMEPVAPLEISASRWVATSTRRTSSSVDRDSPK
jgi:translation initiation factor 4G